MITTLLRFLFEFLNGAFVNATALVYEVTGGGRLARIDVADDHDVDVSLLLGHDGSAVREGRGRDSEREGRGCKREGEKEGGKSMQFIHLESHVHGTDCVCACLAVSDGYSY